MKKEYKISRTVSKKEYKIINLVCKTKDDKYLDIITKISRFLLNIKVQHQNLANIYKKYRSIHEADIEISNIFFVRMKYGNIVENVHTDTSRNKYNVIFTKMDSNDDDITIKELKQTFRGFTSILQIKTKLKTIKFYSRTSLYQIIYSICMYIHYLSVEEIKTPNQAELQILNVDTGLKMIFKYQNGFPVTNKGQLTSIGRDYFQCHANIFRLDMEQVLKILKEHNYRTDVYAKNNTNYIVITQTILRTGNVIRVDFDKR